MQRRKQKLCRLRENMQAHFHFFSMCRQTFTLFFQSNVVFNSPSYSKKSCAKKFSRAYLVLSLNFDENPKFSFYRGVLCISCRNIPVDTVPAPV